MQTPELDIDRLRKECATLMRSGCIGVIVESLSIQLYNEWKSSETPEQRESVYAQSLGLEKIVQTIKNIADSEAKEPQK